MLHEKLGVKSSRQQFGLIEILGPRVEGWNMEAYEKKKLNLRRRGKGKQGKILIKKSVKLDFVTGSDT